MKEKSPYMLLVAQIREEIKETGNIKEQENLNGLKN